MATRTERPVVLRHSFPVPVLSDAGAAGESQARPDSPEIADLLRRRRSACSKLVQLRHAGLSAQLALCLLRVVVNADCTFLARAVGVPAQTCIALDDVVVSSVEALLGLTFGDAQSRRRVFHPFRQGGLGFTSQRLCAEAAHVASWHVCLPRVLSLTRFGRLES